MNIDATEVNSNIVIIRFSSSETTASDDKSVEFDIGNQGKFFELVETILDQQRHHIIVDMSTVRYIDSSALWALFEGHRKAQNQGRAFILYAINADVKRVLSITQLDAKFTIVDTQPDAISAVPIA